ncbi:MAG: peptidylprolyl isomerase [Clostridia bacterium]
MEKNPIVTITMDSGKTIEIELYPEYAPNTVYNFLSLINENFYNGLIFHRVIKGFMIQGGDPTGTGSGGPDYSIKGEFKTNGVLNPLSHTEGVISMARANHPDSAGSQFFIMHRIAPHLDGAYAAFGKVINGMDVVNEIACVDVSRNDKPIKPQIMKTVKAETFGVAYPQPKKIK